MAGLWRATIAERKRHRPLAEVVHWERRERG